RGAMEGRGRRDRSRADESPAARAPRYRRGTRVLADADDPLPENVRTGVGAVGNRARVRRHVGRTRAMADYFLVPTPVIMNYPSMMSKFTPSLSSAGVSVILAANACP